MEMVTGQTTLSINPVPDEIIVNEIIPENAKMLFDFDIKYLSKKFEVADSPLRQHVLEKAITHVNKEKHARRENAVLRGDIFTALGKLSEATEEYEFALVSQPNDPATRYKVGQIYDQLGDLEKALEMAEELSRHRNTNTGVGKRYGKFVDEIRKKSRKALQN